MKKLLLVTLTVSGILHQSDSFQINPKSNKPIKPSILDNSLEILTNNPLSKIVVNTYDFFYRLPRQNLLWDLPTVWWRNSTVDYVRWYQFPHNLPPYRYLNEENEFMKNFFCYGLPGNTLPLGNWDPWGFHLVSKKVVMKYRESEIKHGRLAMLSTLAIIVQENYHPLHPEFGGLAISQMNRLLDSLSFQSNFLTSWIYILADKFEFSDQLQAIPNIYFPIDFAAVIMILMSFEAKALYRNWNRWLPNEYNHQFDHNIGVGNLKEDYENGNYAFDILKLSPKDPQERRDMVEKELNHGRLAMIAAFGMIVQEYLTGYPVMESLSLYLESLTS